MSTIHSFLYREIIKPYYHLLYGKKYEKISISDLPQDAKYKNAKIKRLDELNVLHQTVIPEHAKWVLCKKSKDTKSIKDGRVIIKNAIAKYCGAICDHRDLHSFPTRRSSDLVADGRSKTGFKRF